MEVLFEISPQEKEELRQQYIATGNKILCYNLTDFCRRYYSDEPEDGYSKEKIEEIREMFIKWCRMRQAFIEDL